MKEYGYVLRAGGCDASLAELEGMMGSLSDGMEVSRTDGCIVIRGRMDDEPEPLFLGNGDTSSPFGALQERGGCDIAMDAWQLDPVPGRGCREFSASIVDGRLSIRHAQGALHVSASGYGRSPWMQRFAHGLLLLLGEDPEADISADRDGFVHIPLIVTV